MRLATVIGATLLSLGIATSASAADLPRKAPAPAYLPPAYNWTGFYAGLNAGGGWTTSGGNASGFVGGGQIGYNWQAIGSPWVLGAEADFQGATVRNSASSPAFGVTVNGRMNAFGTLRGRLGYAWDRFMIYGTGGWAYTRTELSASSPFGSVSDSHWSSGWTAGGGVEWGFWDRWSAKVEYLYVDSRDTNMLLGTVPVSGNFKFNVVRAGVNYRF
jgi:outer membrane immunogenic protein